MYPHKYLKFDPSKFDQRCYLCKQHTYVIKEDIGSHTYIHTYIRGISGHSPNQALHWWGDAGWGGSNNAVSGVQCLKSYKEVD